MKNALGGSVSNLTYTDSNAGNVQKNWKRVTDSQKIAMNPGSFSSYDLNAKSKPLGSKYATTILTEE